MINVYSMTYVKLRCVLNLLRDVGKATDEKKNTFIFYASNKNVKKDTLLKLQFRGRQEIFMFFEMVFFIEAEVNLIQYPTLKLPRFW